MVYFTACHLPAQPESWNPKNNQEIDVANLQQTPSPFRAFPAADSSESAPINPFLTEHQAAQFLGVSPATLQSWRTTGRVGLAFIKLGRAVRYRCADLEAFASAQRRTTTA